MVEPSTVQRVREVLGDRPRRILVTGGSGFIGSHLGRALADAGHDVVSTARNRYRTGLAFHPGVEFVAADLCDKGAIVNLASGCDLVYHVGALVSPWAPSARLDAVNAFGTRNLIDGCRAGGGRRLVHVSSASVQFSGTDREAIREDDPAPRKFVSAYAHSKAEAERLVLAAVVDGLDAVIVRARAVFGPGDTSLLPRLLDAARAGRLRVIGDGRNQVDLTWIDNLVYALALAGVRGTPGLTVTVTNQEPVALWPVIREVTAACGLTIPQRSVPYPIAIGIARISEVLNRLIPALGEPMLTRYTVGLLAKTQTFDPARARHELGYAPPVPMREAIAATIAALQPRPTDPAGPRVRCRLFSTGTTPQAARWIEPGGKSEKIPVHATFALIEHPRHGAILFDTGYAPRFAEATARFPYSLYARVTPVRTDPRWTAEAWLRRRGIAPESIRLIILSHFHADHVGGLRDFPNAEVLATSGAWRAVRDRRGWGAVRRAFLPDLLPGDISERLRLLDCFHDPGVGPFEAAHDLFGDGSIRLIHLPGHAAGQIGALLRTDSPDPTFLVADAAWSTRSILENRPPPAPAGLLFDSVRDFRRTLARLHAFHRAFPKVRLVPTHCPRIAREEQLDLQLEEAASDDRP